MSFFMSGWLAIVLGTPAATMTDLIANWNGNVVDAAWNSSALIVLGRAARVTGSGDQRT
jgi:hypothetical protein